MVLPVVVLCFLACGFAVCAYLMYRQYQRIFMPLLGERWFDKLFFYGSYAKYREVEELKRIREQLERSAESEDGHCP